MGIPETPCAYSINEPHELCRADEEVNKRLHAAHFSNAQAQLVYDLDEWDDPAPIDELIAAETGICFGPDTLAEARNRGYRLAEPGGRRRYRRPRS